MLFKTIFSALRVRESSRVIIHRFVYIASFTDVGFSNFLSKDYFTRSQATELPASKSQRQLTPFLGKIHDLMHQESIKLDGVCVQLNQGIQMLVTIAL